MATKVSRKRLGWAAVLTGACLLPAAPARAEAGAAQKAAAESLFDDALKAMKSGRYADACPKLEESERIDPGIGTLLYLGECYEKTGRSASAWATFREAASSAQAKGEADRARIASARADRLQAGLSKLTISVAPETAQLPSLRILRDTAVVESSLYGIAIPVDPGKYRISASAEGYESFQTELEVQANGDAKSVQIPALKPASTAQAGALQTSPPPPATSSGSSPITTSIASPPNNDTGTTAPNGLRTAALVSGAVGIVGLGVGSYFGVRAISKNNDAETYCPAGDKCGDQRGVDLTTQAKHAAVASNIFMTVGAAFVVTGVVLYLTSEPKKSARLELHPMVDRNLAGIGLGGAFR